MFDEAEVEVVRKPPVRSSRRTGGTSKAARLDAARFRYEVALKAMNASDVREQELWDGAKTPFEALAVYRSQAERDRRIPIINELIASRQAIEDIRQNKVTTGVDE